MTQPTGSPYERSANIELDPAAVAAEIIDLADKQGEDGSAIALIARELRAAGSQPPTVDELYYAVTGPFDEFDSGTGNEQYQGVRGGLPPTTQDKLDAILGHVDSLPLGNAAPNSASGPILNRNFALAEGQVAAVVNIADKAANATGGTTDKLFVFPTSGDYYTVRFHIELDEDYDSHRSVHGGLPTPSPESPSELVVYCHSRDYNLRDEDTDMPIVFR